MRIAWVLVTIPLLAACASSRPARAPMPVATEPAADGPKVWARADGRRMSGNRALTEQGQRDLAQCRSLAAIEGEPGKYHLPTLADCMAQRGYIEIEKPT